jgi:hypothetical protein
VLSSWSIRKDPFALGLPTVRVLTILALLAFPAGVIEDEEE